MPEEVITMTPEERQNRLTESREKRYQQNQKIRRSVDAYHRRQEEHVQKVLEGKETDIHYFNGLAAENLEPKWNRDRKNPKARALYPDVYRGQGPHDTLEYQITRESKPKTVTSTGEEIQIEARLFATKKGKDGTSGFLYIMDTNGVWYKQSIKLERIEDSIQYCKPDQKPTKMVDGPKAIKKILEEAI